MSQKREMLFETCQEKIMLAYAEGIKQKVINPVVLLLDVSDPIGRRLAVGAAGEKAVCDLERDTSSDSIPCVYVAIPESVARKTLPEFFSEEATVFLEIPISENQFRLAIISDGGASFGAPLPM